MEAVRGLRGRLGPKKRACADWGAPAVRTISRG
jgi:hypothetical protein